YFAVVALGADEPAFVDFLAIVVAVVFLAIFVVIFLAIFAVVFLATFVLPFFGAAIFVAVFFAFLSSGAATVALIAPNKNIAARTIASSFFMCVSLLSDRNRTVASRQ